ncbi:HEAT repeat domain-containing protein [Micromonospora sp. NPDC052213]|uniref:HEAT repeat domain-containing protein n=1 Tax=Micromonospora sp. NPDC052213 TaxID=3155812 RepID=UPI0034419A9E
MEYFDLSPYDYLGFPLPMRAVGWLGRRYGVQGAGGAPMTGAELERLRAASRRLGSVTLGWHDCDFCGASEGNGEYRYYLPGGEIYAAPMMILHYVEEHGYRPPVELRDGLRAAGQPRWDWRAERLCAVLLDQSEDPDFRCQAAVDLANWNDPRALDALRRAAHDEDLVDVAGDEIGRSLAAFVDRGLARDLLAEDLHVMVRYGIDDASSRWRPRASHLAADRLRSV